MTDRTIGKGHMHPTQLAEVFEGHRARLRQIAYRILGSWPEADDAVQEAWIRLQGAETDQIANLAGWLTTVTSRLCLDRLRSRHARPESPLDDAPAWLEAPDDPAGDAELADSVGRALAVVLDTLSPPERVAFVLHDVFAVPFADIAVVLDRSTEATKKLAARARHRARLRGAEHPADAERHRRVIRAFLDALRAGDMQAVLDLLAPDATRRVDPVLLPAGSPPTLTGARAIVDEARIRSGPARTARPATVDGRPGAAVFRDGIPVLALTFTIADDRIQEFAVIGDPAALAALSITTEA
jgi:RNA polymerase sigma factor (sigma-70 family)